jgi:hypothetical protein
MVHHFLMLWKIFEHKEIFRNKRENMWYIIFNLENILNCETHEMFKYMHGTSFLMLWKIFECQKIFRNRREKIYRNMWYIIIKYRKYL